MTINSKDLLPLLSSKCCSEVFHPWNKNCYYGAFAMLLDGFWNSTKFFSLLHLLQYALHRKKELHQLVRSFVGGVLHGTFTGFIFIISNCFFRNVFKSYKYYLVGFGSGVCAALPVFLEHPSRRNILFLAYLNMVLEVGARQLEQKGVAFFTKSLSGKLMLFMAINSLLMYKLRSNDRNRTSSFWLFTPQNNKKQIPEKNSLPTICQHFEPCWKYILKRASCYFAFGCALQGARMIMFSNKLRLPSRKDTLIPIFTTTYVTLYELINCTLCTLRKCDSPIHAIPAGLISGTAIWLYPNRSILLAALGNLIQIFGADIKEMYRLPDYPYKELAFIIFNGLLHHNRIFNDGTCPNFFIFLSNTFSNNRANILFTSFKRNLEKIMAEEIKKINNCQ